MFAKIMAWVITTWQLDQFGVFKVGTAAVAVLMCCIVVLAMVSSVILEIDRRHARQYKGDVVVKRKYLKYSNENGSCEVEDSRDARLMPVEFILVMNCKEGAEMEYPVKEDLFDCIKVGDCLPGVTYQIRCLTRAARVVGFPTVVWEFRIGRSNTIRNLP